MSINKGTLPPKSYLRDVIHECLLLYLAFWDLLLTLFIYFDCRYQLKKCFLSTSLSLCNIPIYFPLSFWYVPNVLWVFWIGVEGPGNVSWPEIPGVWEGSRLGACVHKRRFELTIKIKGKHRNAHSSEYFTAIHFLFLKRYEKDH